MVLTVDNDFCVQTCQLQCNLVTVPLYSKFESMQFRNPRAVGRAASLHSDAIATALGFLNRVDPRTRDLTII